MTSTEYTRLVDGWGAGTKTRGDGEANGSAYNGPASAHQNDDKGAGTPNGRTTVHADGSIEISERQSIISPDLGTQEKGRISSFSAFVHIVRCHAGSGLLGAARAVNYAGLMVGFFLFIACGLVVLFGMHSMLSCAGRLGKRLQLDHTLLTYQDIVEMTLLHGPQKTRRFAGFGRSAAILFSALLQFGVCSFIFVVVGDGVRQLFRDFLSVELDVRVYMVVMLIVLIGPAFVKRLDILAVFSAIANVLFGSCLLITLGFLVIDLPPITSVPAFAPIASLPMFLGQALMTLEGIAVIIPVQNKMKKPEQFSTCCGVLNLGLGFVITFLTVIGCLGYWRYGTHTATNILLNLPADQWLCVAAKIMLPLSLIMTYPIQFYFIFVMIWPPVADRVHSEWLLENGEYIQRMVILVLTFACAAFVPHLDLLMSLFGSVCATSLGFIIPAAMDIVSRTSDGERITVLRLITDVVFGIFGLFIFFSGSYFAIKEIIATF